jgi:hypothetical protein
MKNLYLLQFLFVFLFCALNSTQITAQERILVITENAFVRGSGADLDAFLNDLVEFNLNNQRKTLGKVEVIREFDKFKQDNPGRVFEYVHTGQTADSLRYAIGNFETQNNRKYRVYILIKENKIRTMDLSGK